MREVSYDKVYVFRILDVVEDEVEEYPKHEVEEMIIKLQEVLNNLQEYLSI